MWAQVSLLLHDIAPAHRSHVGQTAVLNADLKKCTTRLILMNRHQVITIHFQNQRKNLRAEIFNER